MSEAAAEATTEPAETPEPAQAPTTETPAQEPDWKALARKWETQSKANKTALDDLTGKFTAAETERAKLAETVQTYESEKERAALVSEVSEAEGVPSSALRGNTREELEAHAKVLAELIKPTGPVIPGQEKTPDKVAEDPRREFLRGVLNKT